MQKLRILLLCCYSLFACILMAQNMAFENLEADLQRARIGLVDEFMKRFNGTERHPNLKSSATDSLDLSKRWLFDQSLFQNINSQERDSVWNEALSLINSAKTNAVSLNHADSEWLAVAHCKGAVLGKQERFDLFLTVQPRGDDMYKWVINAVDGECFNIAPRVTNDNLIISPDAHETKFIALSRLTKEQPENIKLYLSTTFEYNPTSVFAYLVHAGKLKIEYVENLEFVFLQVPGYAFNIQYFDRESDQSGWLISDFYRFSDADKAAMRKFLHSLEVSQLITYTLESSETKEDEKMNNKDCMMSSVIEADRIAQRIKEKIALLQNYISYLTSSKKSKETKIYYGDKMTKLFYPGARIIVTNSKTDDTKSIDIKKFTQTLRSSKNINVRIDAFNSIVESKTNTDFEESTIALYHSGIIPVSIFDSEEMLRHLCEQQFQFHTEDTEDGVEYIIDFGDMYITLE